jgi:hypothetical protein
MEKNDDNKSLGSLDHLDHLGIIDRLIYIYFRLKVPPCSRVTHSLFFFG